jgi:hypothetical protein
MTNEIIKKQKKKSIGIYVDEQLLGNISELAKKTSVTQNECIHQLLHIGYATVTAGGENERNK